MLSVCWYRVFHSHIPTPMFLELTGSSITIKQTYTNQIQSTNPNRLIINLMPSSHQIFNLRCQFAENFICLLMVFQLGSDELGQIPEGFSRVNGLHRVKK